MRGKYFDEKIEGYFIKNDKIRKLLKISYSCLSIKKRKKEQRKLKFLR